MKAYTYRIILIVASWLISINGASALDISGNIVLPVGYSPAQEIKVNVRVSNTDNAQLTAFIRITIPVTSSGGDVFPFLFSGLSSNATDEWRLFYDCLTYLNPVPCQDFVSRGNYSDAIAGSVVYKNEDTTLLLGNTNHTGLDMTLLQGESVTGIMALPAGESAPADGLRFAVYAKPVSGADTVVGQGYAIIPNGSTQVDYHFTLPNDASESWKFYYECPSFLDPDCSAYLETGYHDASVTDKTTDLETQADIFIGGPPGGSGPPYSSINMRFLTGYSISGDITASSQAPVGGIRVLMTATNQNAPGDIYQLPVIFSQGETTKPYSIQVTTDGGASWRIKYQCDTFATPLGCEDHITQGWYNSSGTVLASGDSEDLAGGMAYIDKDLTLLAGPKISGKLTLAQGVAPAGGLNVNVYADDVSVGGIDSFSKLFTIPEGLSELDYTVVVTSEGGALWRVRYDCWEAASPECGDLVDIAYYDSVSGGMVAEEASAGTLLGGLADHLDIDMVIESIAGDLLCFPVKTALSTAIICF